MGSIPTRPTSARPAALAPAPTDPTAATTAAAELLEVGVITMTLDDTAGTDLDRSWERIVVVYNATPEAQTQTIAGLAGDDHELHPVQAAGADDVVKGSTYDPTSGAFTVPARTVAVFVSD